jgi:hypothetical protein
MADEDPVCRSCGSKCKLVRPIGRFAAEHLDELTATVGNHNFDAISRLTPPLGDTEPQLSLRLMSCPRCGQTNLVTVNHIRWIATKRGRSMVIRPLVNQLLIPADEAARLKEIVRQFSSGDAAGEKLPEIDSSAHAEENIVSAEPATPRPMPGDEGSFQATDGSASRDSDSDAS